MPRKVSKCLDGDLSLFGYDELFIRTSQVIESGGVPTRVTARVVIKVPGLSQMIQQAYRNDGKRAVAGPMGVEIESIQPLKPV